MLVSLLEASSEMIETIKSIEDRTRTILKLISCCPKIVIGTDFTRLLSNRAIDLKQIDCCLEEIEERMSDLILVEFGHGEKETSD